MEVTNEVQSDTTLEKGTCPICGDDVMWRCDISKGVDEWRYRIGCDTDGCPCNWTRSHYYPTPTIAMYCWNSIVSLTEARVEHILLYGKNKEQPDGGRKLVSLLRYSSDPDDSEDLHYAKPGDAGIDLRSTETVHVFPGETFMVGTGVKVEIPEGAFGMLVPRSGIAVKRGLSPINSPGIIDSGYRGEIKVALHNYSESVATVEKDERICQLVIVPFVNCTCLRVDEDELTRTERGTGGFGSTGVM